MRRVGWMGLVLILTVGTASSALAQKRVALVIGNGTYTKVARLDNPKNDAAAMEAMFKAAAFTSVVRLNDLGVTSMKRALRDFSDTAQDADIAVVFYAGHGIEVAGVNYLIPIDAVRAARHRRTGRGRLPRSYKPGAGACEAPAPGYPRRLP